MVQTEPASVDRAGGGNFEVAEDLIGDMIGGCSAQIAAEKSKPVPDPTAVERWIDAAAQYVAERKALDPRDTAPVGAVLAKYGPIVRAGPRLGLRLRPAAPRCRCRGG
jgi:hypothetical protein